MVYKLNFPRKITLSNIYFIVISLILLEPAYVSHNLSSINTIFSILKNLIFVIILFRELFLIINKPNQKSSNFVYLVFLANTVLVISTILNNGEVMTSISRMINITSMVYITEYLLKKNETNTLKILVFLLSCLIILNFITIIIFPNGLYKYYFINGNYNSEYWLLGQKNSIGKVCLITLCLQFILNEFNGKLWNIKIILLTIVSIISVIMVNSMSSTLILIMYILAISILSILHKIHFEKCTSIFRMRNYFIIAIALFLSISIFQTFFSNSDITYFITNNLNRDITLTGRTVVWSEAIKRIQESPILGYGIRNVEDMIMLVKGTIHTSDCHNFYINILFQGGIIATSIYTSLFYTIIKKLDNLRTKKIVMIFSLTLFSFLIIFITECFYYPAMWSLFTVMYHCDLLVEKRNKKNVSK